MIKLFWNSHNQIVPNSDKSNFKELSRNRIWGIYHKDNSNKWIHEILNKTKFKTIINEKEIDEGDILIIIDSSVENKIEFYNKLKLICSKVFLIHLGDETGSYDLSLIYQNCNHVWRTFCSNKYFNNKNVSCLPIGYKTGIIKKFENESKYKWAFIGTPHKSSRHDLLFQLSDIKPFFCHKTQEFNKKIIDVDKMSEILCLTEFMPCPNGFVHPETYRLYEALECECIPIVENAYKYYDRLFPNNPFIKVNKWTDAKACIQFWSKDQIIKKKEECKIWWNKEKMKIQNFIEEKITQ